MTESKAKKTPGAAALKAKIAGRRAAKRGAAPGGLPAEALGAMGQTIEQVMAEEFDAGAIADIRKNAERKAERMVAFSRAEAASKVSSLKILKALREAAGVSQVEMARRLAVSPPAISQMETSDPQMSSVLLYAAALGESLSLTIDGPAGKSSLPFDILKRAAAAHRKGTHMPNTGKKKPSDPDKLVNEQVAIVVAIASLSRKAQRMLLLTPQQVAVLLGRKVKTLEKDRHDRKKALAAGKAIDPMHPMSLPFVAPAAGEREVRYLASDVAAHLAKRAGSVDRPKPNLNSTRLPARAGGFQSWLAHAAPTETWPFCILPNGRPIDMAEAIASGQLNENTARLNLREFSERLATAAAVDYSTAHQ